MQIVAVLVGAALVPALFLTGCGPTDSPVVESAPAGPADSPVLSASVAPANQQALRGADREAKAVARSVAVMLEVSFTDQQVYPSALVERLVAKGRTLQIEGGDAWNAVALNPGTSVSVRTDGTSYCLTVIDPHASRPVIYDSRAGGIQTGADATCGDADGPEIVRPEAQAA